LRKRTDLDRKEKPANDYQGHHLRIRKTVKEKIKRVEEGGERKRKNRVE
jgi:hypothetical protein